MNSETYIKDGKLAKTKKHFYMCKKCGLVLVCPADDSYKYGLCWICFLKSKGYYKSAMEEIKIGWFTWHTKWDFKVGWTFIDGMLIQLLLGAVVNCGSLNKYPKMPEFIDKTDAEILKELGYNEWQIKVFLSYYYDDDDTENDD